MYAVFGLGNPGRSYRMNRHNVGFMLLDDIVQSDKETFRPGKGDYYYYETMRAGQPVLMVKPSTYMNRSGLAVKQVLRHFEIDPENILVAYDDFHLEFGTLRFRKRGSDGGHNGIRSIIYHLETQDLNRLRIGIGSAFSDSVDFVLSDFKKLELEDLGFLFMKAKEGIDVWLERGIEEAMNTYNRKFLN